jgi:lipoprotein-anchoring transpeptidase ErfK/SrfK
MPDKTKKIKKNKKDPTTEGRAKFMYSALLFAMVGMLFYGALVLHDVYFAEENLRIQTSTTKDISQGDEIILKFSSAVDGRFDLSRVNIEPNLEIKPLWISNKELKIKIQGVPEVNQEYTVSVSNIKTFWLNLKKNLAFNFQAAKTPVVINVYPANKQTEVSYDTKIKIDLDESLSEQLFLEIDINPDIDVEAELSEDRTSVQIVPKNNLEKAQQYEVSVKVKDNLREEFVENVYSGKFITKIPLRVVYGFDKNGEPNKTEDLTWAIPAKIAEGKYIDIDLTHQVMSIFEDGLRKGSYKVSSGKRGMDTPVGTFKVFSKVSRPWSAKYGLYMPYYIGFTYQGHGIHELPEWPSGYKEGENHLGIPVSHGCVRLGVGPAKVVYDFTVKGTPIVVHY